ncbi:MAG: hypothetical protein GY702_12525, partial [Desulfobulbaceae bacterium]|nr:hypothetical protein [Desulfobulbaceae bacterium]
LPLMNYGQILFQKLLFGMATTGHNLFLSTKKNPAPEGKVHERAELTKTPSSSHLMSPQTTYLASLTGLR